MKLPKPIKMFPSQKIYSDSVQQASKLGKLKYNEEGIVGIWPMTVSFSPNWDHYSWSKQGHTDKRSEEALIRDMIQKTSDLNVKHYADSNKCNVYVRTGLHGDDDHVQVQLGLPASPWESNDCPGFTCHIEYHAQATGAYNTTCFKGLYSGHR